MSKYFFNSSEQKECIVPFRHKTEEEARCFRIAEYDIKFKQELLDDKKALNNLYALIFTMLMDCRRLKNITLDEEDCKLLFDICHKQVEIDPLKIKET